MFDKVDFKRLKICIIAFILLISIFSPLSAAEDDDDWASIAATSTVTGKVVCPGDTAEFTLDIEKGCNVSDKAWCSLSVSEKPGDWTVGFYKNNDEVTHITFSEGEDETEEVTLRVEVPSDASEGRYSVWSEIDPDDGDVISRRYAVTVDKDAGMSLDMYSNAPGLVTRPNDPVEFDVTLKNDYDNRVTVDLYTDKKPENWDVEFLQDENGQYRQNKISIGPENTQDFIVKVHPDSNSSNGVYPVIINAVPEFGGSEVSQKLEVSIDRSLEKTEVLSVFPNTRSITLNPGGSREITVNLRNSGDQTLNNVELRVQTDSGISTDVKSFGAIDELESGDSESIPVEVSARASVNSGSNEILMRAVSDEVQSDDEQVEVSIEKSSSSGFIGIGMVLVAVIVLALFVYRFGRR